MKCNCEFCNFEDRPFKIFENISRVKGLNKPYTRSGRIFGNILHLIDASIGLISFDYLGSNLGSEYIKRELHKFCQYDDNNKDMKYELEHFKFKLYKMGKIKRPFTRSYKIFGYTLKMIDSLIGIITFGHFDSFISHELTGRELNKLGRFINKYGIEGLREKMKG